MAPDVFEHVLYQLLNTSIRGYPFEHLYVEEVFPKEFYQEILSNMPASDEYRPIDQLGKVEKGRYQERLIFPLIDEAVETLPKEKKAFWQQFMKIFMSELFKKAALFLFSELLEERFAKARSKPELKWTADLVRDTTNYSIGPHTDSPSKVITFLFYLPKDDTNPNLGTSLFASNKPGFADTGNRHYFFDNFKLIKTMPYMPNTMFGFLRTDTSWHGVVPIKEKIERNSIAFQLILSNIEEM